MRNGFISSAACAILILLVQSDCLAADASEEATAAAKTYIGLLKSGNVAQAISEFWQPDALLTASYGLTYLELSAAERERSQAAFASFIAAPYESKRLTELFKTLEIQDATPTEIDASTVAVRLQLNAAGGTSRSVNTLLLAKTDAGWRIVDQRQGAQPSIRAAIVLTYFEESRAATDTIPVVLERVAAEVRKQASAQ